MATVFAGCPWAVKYMRAVMGRTKTHEQMMGIKKFFLDGLETRKDSLKYAVHAKNTDAVETVTGHVKEDIMHDGSTDVVAQGGGTLYKEKQIVAESNITSTNTTEGTLKALSEQKQQTRQNHVISILSQTQTGTLSNEQMLANVSDGTALSVLPIPANSGNTKKASIRREWEESDDPNLVEKAVALSSTPRAKHPRRRKDFISAFDAKIKLELREVRDATYRDLSQYRPPYRPKRKFDSHPGVKWAWKKIDGVCHHLVAKGGTFTIQPVFGC